MNLRDLPHLGRRFFRSLRVRRPGPAAQQWVATHLHGEAARLFFAQSAMDQAHAVDIAHRVERAAPGRGDLVRAALLHDVGKNSSRLGVAGRTAASLLAITHLPTSGRMRDYLEHGRLGATALGALGETPLTVAFARSPHDPRAPAGIGPEDWETLHSADAE